MCICIVGVSLVINICLVFDILDSFLGIDVGFILFLVDYIFGIFLFFL